MSTRRASLAVLLGIALSIGCETESGVLNPTPLGTGLSGTVSLQPSAVAVESVARPSCPTLPPFVGSLNLTVLSPDDRRVSLRSVQMTFTDSAGLSAPSVTLPAPVPTVQAGSALIEARSQRTFPLTFPFGCGTRRTGTLVVVVTVSDDRQRESTAEARVAVR
jgi:hypothetical protein